MIFSKKDWKNSFVGLYALIPCAMNIKNDIIQEQEGHWSKKKQEGHWNLKKYLCLSHDVGN